ncbi:hypothetical protein V6N12_007264 [Hibiscus sabdariffa]|uniref:RNase H type-1 domain-containing protein n=1 Tax=Hibiscus sabdariffa TaxID=183260 RepID=A0ABR2F183_9ROSI
MVVVQFFTSLFTSTSFGSSSYECYATKIIPLAINRVLLILIPKGRLLRITLLSLRKLFTLCIGRLGGKVGWLNSDSRAACGGVLRDHNESWLLGFAKFVGVCTAEEAKLWGIYTGLLLA